MAELKRQPNVTSEQLPIRRPLMKEQPYKRIIPQLKKKTNKKYIIPIATLVISSILTPLAVMEAYRQRGYFAIGGEYLMPALIYITLTMAASVPGNIKEIKNILTEERER